MTRTSTAAVGISLQGEEIQTAYLVCVATSDNPSPLQFGLLVEWVECTDYYCVHYLQAM